MCALCVGADGATVLVLTVLCRQGLKGPQVRGGRGRRVSLSTWEFVLVLVASGRERLARCNSGGMQGSRIGRDCVGVECWASYRRIAVPPACI
jgi:hypothetical protein